MSEAALQPALNAEVKSSAKSPGEVARWLEAQQQKSLLRFITCGSVDDGKSTLIGRLLYDSKLIYADQLAQLEADSRRIGTQGGDLDFALLVDGLAAEREQGITIDVAYRFFSTEKRKFIVADAPGHEQYTRNMVTGASTADLAVILLDARKGVLTQTRRHTFLARLLGVRHVVLAVNKMDLVGFNQGVFETIEGEFRAFAQSLGHSAIEAIPISALAGDNVIHRSPRMAWREGPSLLEHLEGVQIEEDRLVGQPLRLPVQWVNRPDPGFRGFSGMIVSGAARVGEKVRVLPSGRETTIARILAPDLDRQSALAGQSVTLTFAEEIDCSRGDVVCSPSNPAQIADQFEATLVWMGDEPLLPGRDYGFKMGAQNLSARVHEPKYKINVNTLDHLATRRLELNEIGVANLALDRPAVFDPYEQSSDMGGFILIDKVSNATVAAGMIAFALRRSQNIHWQALDVTSESRAQTMGQKAAVLWFTGLSGAGKSTIANLVERRLHSQGRHTYLLDGDNVRHGLNRDLGFTDADRVENIRRVAEVARLMADAGLIVLVSFISPFRSERKMARELMKPGEFFEVFVDTPLETAERRDVKGLYAKARAGELANFTGIDSPYEAPEAPEIHIRTESLDPAEAADRIVARLDATDG
ncbi:MAG: sulfate adenylyltransferase subunit CysN [Caulobacteraceae bacterium]